MGIITLNNIDDYIEHKQREISSAEETERYTDSDDSHLTDDDEE